MASLPFTHDEFFAVFERYNLALWPGQVLAYALAVAVFVLVLRPVSGGDRVISAILAAAWAVMGAGYHMAYFAEINPAAWAFGAMFLAQATLLVWTGVLKGQLGFRFAPDLTGCTGFGLMMFATAAYPLLGMMAGQHWPQAAIFGVAPCPTTIFTIGTLILAGAGAGLMAIPILWGLIGGSAAFLLGVPQDLSLPVAAAIGLAAAIRTRRARVT